MAASGGEFIAGIRPEDVVVSAKKTKGSVEVMVSVIEPAGSYNWVDALRGEVKVKGIAKTDQDLEPGQSAFLHFSNDKVIFFDPTTGLRC
jgi:ABC-type sugar transport system ATPase subunit